MPKLIFKSSEKLSRRNWHPPNQLSWEQQHWMLKRWDPKLLVNQLEAHPKWDSLQPLITMIAVQGEQMLGNIHQMQTTEWLQVSLELLLLFWNRAEAKRKDQDHLIMQTKAWEIRNSTLRWVIHQWWHMDQGLILHRIAYPTLQKCQHQASRLALRVNRPINYQQILAEWTI